MKSNARARDLKIVYLTKGLPYLRELMLSGNYYSRRTDIKYVSICFHYDVAQLHPRLVLSSLTYRNSLTLVPGSLLQTCHSCPC